MGRVLTEQEIAERRDPLCPEPATFEEVVEVTREDGGASLQVEVSLRGDTDADDGMFVRILSWDTTGEHAHLCKFLGKRIRLTLEVLDD